MPPAALPLVLLMGLLLSAMLCALAANAASAEMIAHFRAAQGRAGIPMRRQASKARFGFCKSCVAPDTFAGPVSV
jgi:hypothetical protein